MEDADDFDGYETGPFCRHYSDPVECEIKCAACGHRCPQHYVGNCGTECMECDCPEWVEPEEKKEA